ncbi:trans-aconitate 2-methyltransferase [Devosia sp. ZB163]|uniref:trans-aconitate 2-methyltransferase n=1 Tax=Devosia sp. ZB163 TaxID=3025938 RepID=UPI002362C6D0|nr:trans-aconitate 2-methyltransferase [Devosia sp. ZB163]MDC9825903.1 trans-aconitate 2-methyltransferase [Devosia sp. ZB163]
MADWSPANYLKFEDERTRPARDLLAQVPVARPRRVVDMGCGPGNSTELLVERFPEAEVVGLDNSPNMLAEARKRVPRARFAEADAGKWVPDAGTDVVFANAIYQWVPDHLEGLSRVAAGLPAGGVLAVQMPDNVAEPSHQLMRQVAAEGPWAEKLRDAARPPLPPVRTYYDALRPVSQRLDIWHAVYNHVLSGPEAIVEWVKGTGLRPFIDPLEPDEREDFLARYLALIAEAYPRTGDGKVLLRFPRLFIVAVK